MFGNVAKILISKQKEILSFQFINVQKLDR